MGTGDLFGDFRERRIIRAGILESVFRHGDRVSAAMPFAHQPGARLQAETWIRSDSACRSGTSSRASSACAASICRARHVGFPGAGSRLLGSAGHDQNVHSSFSGSVSKARELGRTV